VRHYIATAEPVGSKVLADEYDFSVSSATIRNTMGNLEKAGFLYQPHISAGRIPSDSGYRIYVDQLLSPPNLVTEQVARVFAGELNWEAWSLEAVLRRAAQILASLSGCITLITLPQTYHARLRHLQLVQVDPGQIMLILVTTAYETKSALFQLPQGSENSPEAIEPEEIERELQILSNFLNYRLRGKLLQELAQLDWNELGQEIQRYADRVQQLLGNLGRQAPRSAPCQILVSGVAEALRQPEFNQLDQVQTLLQLLEDEQEQLWPLIFTVSDQDIPQRIKVWIGSENPLQPMRSCSLVSALYHQQGTPVGSVGVLGPTRMVYEDAIVAVETTADYLSDWLSETGGNG
jgi:heat-inducible transcriptional repressor